MHLERFLPVARPFAQFFVFGTNWPYNLPYKFSDFKVFPLDSLVISLIHLIFMNEHVIEGLFSYVIC